MWQYDKKLQYPVKIDKPNPKLASIIISQYGGPDGELGASLRYLSQRYSMPFDELKGLLTDIGTEELAHVEMRFSAAAAAVLLQYFGMQIMSLDLGSEDQPTFSVYHHRFSCQR